MERIIPGAITSQMKHVLGKSQHGFTKGKLCLTNLIAFGDKVTSLADVGRTVDIAYLDFSKAFNMVSHSLLLEQLMRYALDKWSMRWMHPEGGGEQVLFELATCHKRGPPGIDIGCSAV